MMAKAQYAIIHNINVLSMEKNRSKIWLGEKEHKLETPIKLGTKDPETPNDLGLASNVAREIDPIHPSLKRRPVRGGHR